MACQKEQGTASTLPSWPFEPGSAVSIACDIMTSQDTVMSAPWAPLHLHSSLFLLSSAGARLMVQ